MTLVEKIVAKKVEIETKMIVIENLEKSEKLVEQRNKLCALHEELDELYRLNSIA